VSVSVCVSTYGEERWAELARSRAIPSAEGQGVEVVFTHMPEGSVALARNASAEQASGEWLVFLDADDELSSTYVREMLNAVAVQQIATDQVPSTTLFTPAVSYCVDGRAQAPKFWPVVPYQDANWMVVGTMISRRWFNELGGFRNYGDPPGSNAYEDWGLWALAQREGSTVVKVPDAVYVAWVTQDSRHRGSDHATRVGWHFEIGRDLFGDERYPDDWVARQGRPRRAAATARRRR
jgi:glycosyltransferase involved in cell wall biosynthesis